MIVSIHPFHVSVSEVDHNPDAESLQVTHRIFLDDMEMVLRNTHSDQWFDIVEPTNPEQRDSWVKEYVMKHFKIILNGSEIRGNYLGTEIDQDVIYCYVEFEPCPKIETIEISSTILLETFEDQVNLVHVTFEDNIKSLKIDHQKRSGILQF